MSYEKLDRSPSIQEILLLNEDEFNIYGIFTVDKNDTITEIKVIIKEETSHNIYALKNAFICSKVIKNTATLYLVINLKDVGKSGQHESVIISKIKEDNSKIETGQGYVILSHVHYYEEDNQAIDNCNIDIYNIKFELNPKTKKGNIIVGNP